MPIASPWTTVFPALSTGTLGDGSLTVRMRRKSGAFEIAGQLSAGTSTVIGGYIAITTEPLPSPTLWGSGVRLENDYVLPAFAMLNSAATPVPGIVRFQLVTPEGGNNVYTGIRMWPVFDGVAWSTTVPFTWVQFSYMVFGNAIEAFDN